MVLVNDGSDRPAGVFRRKPSSRLCDKRMRAAIVGWRQSLGEDAPEIGAQASSHTLTRPVFHRAIAAVSLNLHPLEVSMSTDHAKALALVREGKWDEAHELVQRSSDRQSCLIHAYLHRVEGDMGNARYWYSRAHESMPDNTLEEEWRRLHALVIADSSGRTE